MKNTAEDAFRKVLKMYQSTESHSRYICINLMSLMRHGDISPSQCVDAKYMINDFLGGHSCLEDWLIANYNISSPNVYFNPIKMKETRINWLKYLIKYCKKNNL